MVKTIAVYGVLLVATFAVVVNVGLPLVMAPEGADRGFGAMVLLFVAGLWGWWIVRGLRLRAELAEREAEELARRIRRSLGGGR